MSRLIGILLLVAALLAGGFLMLRHGYVYEIPQADIQQSLTGEFPVERCVLVFCIELRRPFVRFGEDPSRIGFGSDASVEVGFSNKRHDGRVAFTGRLDYVPEEAAFYLRDARLEHLEMSGVADKYQQPLEELTLTLVSEYLRAHPLYSLADTAWAPLAPWLELKETRVRDDALQLRLGLAL